MGLRELHVTALIKVPNTSPCISQGWDPGACLIMRLKAIEGLFLCSGHLVDSAAESGTVLFQTVEVWPEINSYLHITFAHLSDYCRFGFVCSSVHISTGAFAAIKCCRHYYADDSKTLCKTVEQKLWLAILN